MEDDSSDKRRLILAAGLCLLVMMGWPYLFPPPDKPVALPKDAGPVATSTTGSTVATSTRSAAPVAQKQVPTETFEFAGSVVYDEQPHPYQAKLINTGGGIERWVLPTYKERD